MSRKTLRKAVAALDRIATLAPERSIDFGPALPGHARPRRQLPVLPSEGGSFIRLPDGSLVPEPGETGNEASATEREE